jgi:transcriptional regulator with XRE-family HTH domain
VDVCLMIKRRLEELGLEQKDLATAAEVTESYVSQLLARKKLPPAPDRTDIYEKMAKFLKLPSDRLSKLAELERRDALKKGLAGPPAPMFAEIRELIVRKCVAANVFVPWKQRTALEPNLSQELWKLLQINTIGCEVR